MSYRAGMGNIIAALHCSELDAANAREQYIKDHPELMARLNGAAQ